MSSIYKKGRDGYFYYQTYILNTETGKKDKKIFHSLGTKDEKIAEEKKILLDRRYEEKNKNQGNQKFKRNKKLYFYSIILISMVIYFFNYFQNLFLKKESDLFSSYSLSDTLNDEIKISSMAKNPILVPSSENIYQSKNHSIDTIMTNNNDLNKIKDDQEITLLPTYKIIRTERLPNSFNQIKVYATIDSIVTSDGMLFLCEKLKEEYLEFTSIIICLYANNKDGIEMAKNNNAKISKHLMKKNWLAMYTFNPVEGKYFDDNPGLYLGLY
ncbi:MAG: hypothetical protein CMG55_06065 [Candidatus Marinimicrobia bacterium]|nr:hypothetical protein [Candidatus Neomarinimicrobiota bacterium]|tara:strand:- start:1615 stop:2424 length:810 start_codon:yes stop_codon:yes gene_type:complete